MSQHKTLEAAQQHCERHHQRAALVSPGDGWTANCCHCGRIIDTREREDGGDAFGCQHDDGRWTCSDECSEATYPLPDWLKGVGDAPGDGGRELGAELQIIARTLPDSVSKDTCAKINRAGEILAPPASEGADHG